MKAEVNALKAENDAVKAESAKELAGKDAVIEELNRQPAALKKRI